MKVSDLNVNNDLATLLRETLVVGQGEHAKKALTALTDISVSYTDKLKRVLVLTDVKTKISVEIHEQLELAMLTQLSKEFGPNGSAYKAGNLLNKSFKSCIAFQEEKITSLRVFEKNFNVENMLETCKIAFKAIVKELVASAIDLEDSKQNELNTRLAIVELAFMTQEQRYKKLKKENLLDMSNYFSEQAYCMYEEYVRKESRFDCLPARVQVEHVYTDSDEVVVTATELSVAEFVSLQAELKEIASDKHLSVRKYVRWNEDNISIKNVDMSVTLKLKK